MKLEKPTRLADGLAFPEGPRWHDEELWFSDMHDGRVLRLDGDGALHEIVRVPARPSGLGWLPDGRLLVVSMLDRRVLLWDGAALSEHANLHALARFHTNDMVVDARGGAYVGNFGFDLDAKETPRATELLRVSADGAVSVAADELMFPNGCVITPDGKTLIVGETFAARLSAFSIDGDGALHNRRVFAALTGGAVPDGICLDAEGAVWVASPTTNEFLRVHEGGEVSARVESDQPAIACMLGGDDGRTLFLLTAATTNPAKTVKLRSGRIESVRVPVAHAGLP